MEKEEPRYFILVPGSRSRGPFRLSDLRQWAREGRIGPETEFSLDGTTWFESRRMVSVFPDERVGARARETLRRELRAPKNVRGKAWALAVGALLLAACAAPFFLLESIVARLSQALRIPLGDALRYAIGGVLLAAALACAWLARGLWARGPGVPKEDSEG